MAAVFAGTLAEGWALTPGSKLAEPARGASSEPPDHGGDDGADVVGRLPDGRKMIVQCKRYAPSSAIASRELRDLLGAKTHFEADVAVFVTTTRFSRPSEAFAVQHGILALHRDHLGLWNNGAPLTSLISVNGAGQGDRRHRARWQKTYGR